MKTEEIISALEKTVLEVFKREFKEMEKRWYGPHTITAEDLFNRYINTGKKVNGDRYISALCLRLTQAGIPCYPVADEPLFTGIKSELRNDEIKDIIFSGRLIDGNIEKTLKILCNKKKGFNTDRIVLA